MMQTAVDQMGRTVIVPERPRRIISLVPSQTELLFDLGLGTEIVGITKFCVHPAELVKTKQTVGGTKQFRFDVIDAMQPDLIIGNKEENYKEGIERLANKYPVWMSDIKSLPEALAMMGSIGQLLGKGKQARKFIKKIMAGFADLPKTTRPYRTAYFIWQKPVMVAGSDTFIHDMLVRCGFINAFAPSNGRYPEVTTVQIIEANLDLILLSSEPFPFREKHRELFQNQFPGVRVELVDGQMFSWYGSRLLTAVTYLRDLISRLSD